uniref:Major facilitator superfamily (MFS) profile domain-containing protein n=1 Tax=Ditylenchus dipsaci TaxID=166011 RepID=A0A915DL91_9BILA
MSSQYSKFLFAPSGSTWRTIIFTAFFGFFGSFYQAYAMASTNTAADVFKAFIDDSYAKRGTPLSPTTSIWIWSFTINCFTVGNILADFFVPAMADKLGRKFCVMFANAGMVTASLLGALSLWHLCLNCLLLAGY